MNDQDVLPLELQECFFNTPWLSPIGPPLGAEEEDETGAEGHLGHARWGDTMGVASTGVCAVGKPREAVAPCAGAALGLWWSLLEGKSEAESLQPEVLTVQDVEEAGRCGYFMLVSEALPEPETAIA